MRYLDVHVVIERFRRSCELSVDSTDDDLNDEVSTRRDQNQVEEQMQNFFIHTRAQFETFNTCLKGISPKPKKKKKLTTRACSEMTPRMGTVTPPIRVSM